MKRAITALTLVCALMLSVVACQVYNPTTNETLYSDMKSEQLVAEKYFEDFYQLCYEQKAEDVVSVFLEYDEFYLLAKKVVSKANAKEATDDRVDLYDVDAVKAKYKSIKSTDEVFVERLKVYKEQEDAYQKAVTACETEYKLYVAYNESGHKNAKAKSDSYAKAKEKLEASETELNRAKKKIKLEDTTITTLYKKEYGVKWDWNGELGK